MEYLYQEEINGIVPDTQFRQRDPIFKRSESVQKHKHTWQKNCKDKPKGKNGFSSDKFVLNHQAKICVCPNGHEMLYHGDPFTINNKHYMRFKSYLKNCRVYPLQRECMKKPLKEHGRQVSFLIEEAGNTNYLELMKAKIDSE